MTNIRSNLGLILVSMVIVLSYTGCQSMTSEIPEKGRLLRMVIFPAGMSTETYVVDLSRNGKMVTRYGTQRNDIYDSDKFLVAEHFKSRQLSVREMDRVRALSAVVGHMDELRKITIRQDAWEAVIIYGTKHHHIYMEDREQYPKALQELIDYILWVTPLKIDMHGWS
jgi:hypothetical protein